MQPDLTLVNRVANSGLLTLNLEDFKDTREVVELDIKDYLHMGLLLKEKDFRAWVQSHDWAQYTDQNVAVFCSTDAIVPSWAYLLVGSKLAPHAHYFTFGTRKELELRLYFLNLNQHDWAQYADAKVVLKGCGGVPEEVYVEATRLLMPHVQKLMFGEPCSTVPVYKR
jgi:hypothetical protein